MPDIAFFLFFVIALDQGLEYLRHRVLCPDWDQPVRQGTDFIVCQAAKLPQSSAPDWVHEAYGLALAIVTFAIVFGAFAANVLFGAMRAVPRAQMETAEAYGMTHAQAFRRVMVPQMWVYALPGLSNLWMILIKATPLLFLLGVQDIVYWARDLGGSKMPQFTDYPHGDWRMWYFGALLVFYLVFTRLSEIVLGRVMAPALPRAGDGGGRGAAPRGRRAPGPREAPMSCWDTVQAYGLRRLGIGEKLLPTADITLCQQVTLIGSGLLWNIYFGRRGAGRGLRPRHPRGARQGLAQRAGAASPATGSCSASAARRSSSSSSSATSCSCRSRQPSRRPGSSPRPGSARWSCCSSTPPPTRPRSSTARSRRSRGATSRRRTPTACRAGPGSGGSPGPPCCGSPGPPTPTRRSSCSTPRRWCSSPASRRCSSGGTRSTTPSYFADKTYNPFVPYPILAGYFILLTLTVVGLFWLGSRRLNRHLPGAPRPGAAGVGQGAGPCDDVRPRPQQKG